MQTLAPPYAMHRPSHVEAILRRAAQIEASATDPAATLTDDDLVEAGKAAGLSEEAIRQAIAEQRLAPVQGGNGAEDLRWTVTRRVPSLTDGQRAEMFSTVRRAAPYSAYITSTPVESFGEAQQWTAEVQMMGTWARLRIAPASDGEGDVWTMEHYASLDVAGLVWFMGIGGAVVGGILGLIAAAALNVPSLIGAMLALFVTAAALGATKSVRRRILARRRRQFDATVSELDRMAKPEMTRTQANEQTASPAPLLALDDAAPEPESDASTIVQRPERA